MEFCGACFDCRREGAQESQFFKNVYELLLFLPVKSIVSYSTRNFKIQAPGTTFSNFGHEVWMEGHGNCCRFASLTGVHQGAHISLAKYWIDEKVRS